MKFNTFTLALLVTCLLMPVAAGVAHVTGLYDLFAMLLGVPLLGMSFATGRLQGDKQLEVSKALPAATGTVASDGIDLDITSRSDFVAGAELLLESPALTAVQLADTETLVYDVYHDDASDFSGEELLHDNLLTLTGDGSAVAAAEARCALPTDVKRYLRVKATLSDGDCSAASMTASLRA